VNQLTNDENGVKIITFVSILASTPEKTELS